MMEMDYGLSSEGGSGAYSDDIPIALHNYLGYSQCTFFSKGDFSAADWQAKLVSELDSDHPLLYSGSSSQGGHQFIIDGYRQDGSSTYFHFNFGWGGYDDGFYTLDGIDFTSRQAAVLNVTPGSSSYEPFYVLLYQDPDFSGIASDVVAGQQYSCIFYFINCDSVSSASGTIRFELQRAGGGSQELYSIPFSDLASYYYRGYQLYFTIPDYVNPGDKLVFQCAPSGSEDFKTMTVRDNGGVPFEFPLMASVPFIDITNPSSISYARNVESYVDKSEGEDIRMDVTYTDGTKEKIVGKKSNQ